ncbi:hypothetical protein C8J56DRAFT_1026007, partial [Mycena floridula]
MILSLISHFFGLLHGSPTGVEALQLTLLPNPVVLDASAEFQWDAIDTDPDQFTMEVALDSTSQFPFANIARDGKLQGLGETPVLSILGPHTMQ